MEASRETHRSEEELDALAATFSKRSVLESVVAAGDVVLLRGPWLVEQMHAGKLLPKRQELPPEAGYHGSLSERDVRIVAVSYPWCTKDHPDPEGFHLKKLGSVLEYWIKDKQYVFMKDGEPDGRVGGRCVYMLALGKEQEVAVFLDWCSLYQAPRSEEQQASFERALKNINVWYASCVTDVWLLTQMPAGLGELRSYDARGWTSFERKVSELITPSSCVLDMSYAPDDLSTVRVSPHHGPWFSLANETIGGGMRRHTSRAMPLTPEEFAIDLEQKTFTNGADHGFVAKKYAATHADLLASVVELSYSSLRWNMPLQTVCDKLLIHCHRLKTLDLGQNHLTGTLDCLVLCGNLCDTLEEFNMIESVLTGSLAPLVKCKKLQRLNLNGSRSLQGPIAPLAELPQLTFACLWSLKLEGVEEYRAAHPHVKLMWKPS